MKPALFAFLWNSYLPLFQALLHYFQTPVFVQTSNRSESEQRAYKELVASLRELKHYDEYYMNTKVSMIMFEPSPLYPEGNKSSASILIIH